MKQQAETLKPECGKAETLKPGLRLDPGGDGSGVDNRPAPHAHPAGFPLLGNAGAKSTPGPQVGAGKGQGSFRERMH